MNDHTKLEKLAAAAVTAGRRSDAEDELFSYLEAEDVLDLIRENKQLLSLLKRVRPHIKEHPTPSAIPNHDKQLLHEVNKVLS